MNSKERIVTALSCRIPDRVPVFDVVAAPVLARVAEMLDLQAVAPDALSRTTVADGSLDTAHLLCAVIEALDLDGAVSAFSMGYEPEGEGRVRDRYGRGRW